MSSPLPSLLQFATARLRFAAAVFTKAGLKRAEAPFEEMFSKPG
jgi:hypothetical protein